MHQSRFASASLSGYLSPTTRVYHIAGLAYLIEDQTLVLFVALKFRFEFKTVKQPELEARSPGRKAGMLILSYAPLTSMVHFCKIKVSYH